MRTLYLLQADATDLKTALERLSGCIGEQDGVMLLGDSVLAVYEQIFAALAQGERLIYALNDDGDLLPTRSSRIQWIDYAEWVGVLEQYERCVRWK